MTTPKPPCDCIGTDAEDALCAAMFARDLEEASEVNDLIGILPDHVQFRVDL